MLRRLLLWFKKPRVSYLITDTNVEEIWYSRFGLKTQRSADTGMVLIIKKDVRGSGIVYYRFHNQPFDGSEILKYTTSKRDGAIYIHQGYDTKVLLDKKYRILFGYYPSRIYIKRLYDQ